MRTHLGSRATAARQIPAPPCRCASSCHSLSSILSPSFPPLHLRGAGARRGSGRPRRRRSGAPCLARRGCRLERKKIGARGKRERCGGWMDSGRRGARLFAALPLKARGARGAGKRWPRREGKQNERVLRCRQNGKPMVSGLTTGNAKPNSKQRGKQERGCTIDFLHFTHVVS